MLSKKILDDFANDEKLSVLLQKSALLAKLVDDAINQQWIDKEISASFNLADKNDLGNICLNGRYWTKNSKTFYRLEHVEVLEQLIESEKIRLNSAQDPDISYAPTSAYDTYRPHGNGPERAQIIESIRVMQSILSAIKGRLYKFVLNTYYVLNLSEIVTEIFSGIKKNVENDLKEFAPDVLRELVTAYDEVNSSNQARWSNVASGCRRIMMKMADKLSPPTGKKIKTKSGEEKSDKELYRLRLREWLKNTSKEDAVASDTLEYLFELLDSVDRLSAKGDKNNIEKSTAEKILIYTYILLSEFLGRNKK